MKNGDNGHSIHNKTSLSSAHPVYLILITHQAGTLVYVSVIYRYLQTASFFSQDEFSRLIFWYQKTLSLCAGLFLFESCPVYNFERARVRFLSRDHKTSDDFARGQ